MGQQSKMISSQHGISIFEHTLLEGNAIASRVYTVQSDHSPEVPNFPTYIEAECYREAEILSALNPKRAN